MSIEQLKNTGTWSKMPRYKMKHNYQKVQKKTFYKNTTIKEQRVRSLSKNKKVSAELNNQSGFSISIPCSQIETNGIT